jgi:hypothetical protein
MSPFDSLSIAYKQIEEVKRGLREAKHCPCCGQLCKLYRRKLNSNMAVFLISLVREFRLTGQWVHYKKCHFTGRDYSYLLIWGLAMTGEDDSGEKRTSGFWKPTQLGLDFVDGEIEVASHVFLFDNEVQGFSPEFVSIREALGNKFNYTELMG